MRDFRDAKTMAQTLRESLTTKAVNISHSESLELVSKMLGVADWNTLSALLQVDRRDAPVAGRSTAVVSYPAFPLKDLVPFPKQSGNAVATGNAYKTGRYLIRAARSRPESAYCEKLFFRVSNFIQTTSSLIVNNIPFPHARA
jgi:Glyoxalase superfamily protein